jgi:multisubunit Na+/H+ antiporter MnhB subunit
MRWVFALSLILGMLALILWAMVQGKQRSRPGRGVNAARAIAAAVAFGMGGLSAAYAGWSLWVATLVAAGVAALAAWYAGTVATPGGEGRD